MNLILLGSKYFQGGPILIEVSPQSLIQFFIASQFNKIIVFLASIFFTELHHFSVQSDWNSVSEEMFINHKHNGLEKIRHCEKYVNSKQIPEFVVQSFSFSQFLLWSIKLLLVKLFSKV